MPKSQPSRSAANIETDVPEYGSGMRIFGGVSWGTLLTLVFASVLVVIPQIPRPWLWVVPPTWLGLIILGVAMQWSVARGLCPKCSTPLVVPPGGRRCPQCKTALKAQNREIVRLY